MPIGTSTTNVAAPTIVVSVMATTNNPEFILQDYVDSKGETLSTMAPVLEMVTPILSFVYQKMMRVYDIMQQLFKQLGDIVKPMVINEIQKAREEEHHHHIQLEASTNFLPRIQPCQPQVTRHVAGVEVYGSPLMQFGMMQMARHPPNKSKISKQISTVCQLNTKKENKENTQEFILVHFYR